MTLLDFTPWWRTRTRRIRRKAVLHWRLLPLEVLNKRATSFGDSFHSFVVPKTERSSSQKNSGNHTKDSLGMAWHSMISAWCVEGWLVPALVKENLTKKLHWLKSRADISTSTTTPEDESFLYMQCYHRSLPTWATACWYRKGISKFNAFYMKPVSFTIVSNN